MSTPSGSAAQVGAGAASTRLDAALFAAIAEFRRHQAAPATVAGSDEGIDAWNLQAEDLLQAIADVAPWTARGVLAKVALALDVLLAPDGAAASGCTDAEQALIEALVLDVDAALTGAVR